MFAISQKLASGTVRLAVNDNCHLRLVSDKRASDTVPPSTLTRLRSASFAGRAYDSADRVLTRTDSEGYTLTYGYDNVDNATTVTTPSGTVTPAPAYNGFNQIKTWGSLSYVYDADGNLTSGDGVKTYKYDAENRLIEIDYVGTSNKSVFTYDGIGHRISDAETVSGTTTTTYYEWCGASICQTRNSSQTAIRRDLAEGEYNVSTGQKLVYMPDQLGSVRDVIDATTGTRVASYDFTPYGAVARSSVTNGTDYQYAWLFSHPASALNFSATRAEDGVTGRWINRDPIRENGGINLYTYVKGRTITATDPNGTGTPIVGPPGSTILLPGPTIRVFDPNGNASYDIDYGHDHGAGCPHAHNWDGTTRSPGYPITIIP